MGYGRESSAAMSDMTVCSHYRIPRTLGLVYIDVGLRMKCLIMTSHKKTHQRANHRRRNPDQGKAMEYDTPSHMGKSQSIIEGVEYKTFGVGIEDSTYI